MNTTLLTDDSPAVPLAPLSALHKVADIGCFWSGPSAPIDEAEQAKSVLMALARTVEGRDPYTAGHCDRLSYLAGALGQELGLPTEQIIALRQAGIVHDIGKVAVPDSILLKTASLSSHEWAIMQKHPLVGEQICAPLKSFLPLLSIIRHHHEKLDGTGYPDHLRGSEIPVGARVLQIVDIYDSLTTERAYKPAFSTPEALAVLRREVERGWRDAEIFGAFERMMLVESRCNLKH